MGTRCVSSPCVSSVIHSVQLGRGAPRLISTGRRGHTRVRCETHHTRTCRHRTHACPSTTRLSLTAYKTRRLVIPSESHTAHSVPDIALAAIAALSRPPAHTQPPWTSCYASDSIAIPLQIPLLSQSSIPFTSRIPSTRRHPSHLATSLSSTRAAAPDDRHVSCPDISRKHCDTMVGAGNRTCTLADARCPLCWRWRGCVRSGRLMRAVRVSD